MTGSTRFEFRFHSPRPERAAARRLGAPFRILVLGDFSGAESRPDAPARATLDRRAPAAVDPDTFDTVFARLAPRIDLAGSSIEFESLDDFHPDRLIDRLRDLDELREIRRRLMEPASYEEGVVALERLVAAPATAPEAAVEPPGSGTASLAETVQSESESESDTLGRLLGREAPESRESPKDALRSQVEQLIRGAVAPAVVPAQPRRDEHVARVDRAMGTRLNEVLHHPGFQALESLWRSVRRLAFELELGEELQLRLLDLSRRELFEDLRAAGDDLERSALHRVLVEAPGEAPWSLVVGAFRFGTGAADVEALGALGAIASRAGAPFLAEADPGVIGAEALAATPDPRDGHLEVGAEERWTALRRSPGARWLGLALPRVLLRVPYGKATDPIERFGFEEFAEERRHESYLWGSPAFVCSELIARSFTESGAAMEPGDHLEIGDVPVHAFTSDGASRLQPGTEALLTERAADAVLARGVMPVLGRLDRPEIRLAGFRSLADPPSALAGPWGGGEASA